MDQLQQTVLLMGTVALMEDPNIKHLYAKSRSGNLAIQDTYTLFIELTESDVMY